VTKPVVPRRKATEDAEAAVDHYLIEAGVDVALQFVDALQAAYAHIGGHPASGSPRHGHELALPGLRSWPLPGFPYLVFYVERTDHVDVWRVLHGHRDIPPALV